MKYYPIVKKWKKLKGIIERKEVQDILVRDFNKYTFGRWKQPFTHGMKPGDFESCDWRFSRVGRHPEFWDYVKHAASFWLVNFNLRLAMFSEPKRDWQIMYSDLNATVWDGKETIFDMNYLALGVDVDEGFELAYDEGNCEILEIGKEMEVFFAEHYTVDKHIRNTRKNTNPDLN